MAIRRKPLAPSTPTTMDPRTALYARVSSDDQADRNTIQGQKEYLYPYAERQGWAVVDTYFDDGIKGGLPLAERPEGNRLLADAQAGKFARVLFYRVDRFGRNQTDSIQSARLLLKHHIEIVSATEPFDPKTPFGFFMFSIMSGYAELHKTVIQENCANGRRRLARDGRWLGGIVPYGYAVDSERHLVLSERWLPEACMMEWELVRDVIRRIAAGSTAIREAQRLNALGVPTTAHSTRGAPVARAGGRWRANRLTAMVWNTVYAGDGSLRSLEGDIPRQVPAIVTVDEQHRAQAQLRANKSFRSVPDGYAYLLQGRVRCGQCGRMCTGSGGNATGSMHYYRCYAANSPRVAPDERCHGRLIQAPWLEARVWEACAQVLAHPEEVLAQLQTALTAPLPAHQTTRTRISRLEKQLALLPTERQELLTRYRKGKLTEADLDAQEAAIRDEQAALERELATLTQEAQRSTQAAEDLASVAALLTRLREAWKALQGPDVPPVLKRQLLADLRVQVTITPPSPDTAPRSGTSTVQLRILESNDGFVPDTSNRPGECTMAELQDEKVSTVWTWAYSHAPAPLPVPREVLSARVRAIQAKLRAEGRHVGRPSRYAPKTQATMVEAYCTGVPTAQIMQHYAISRARLYALLQHAGVTGQRAVQPVMTCDHRARPRDSHGRFAPMPVPQLTLFATKD